MKKYYWVICIILLFAACSDDVDCDANAFTSDLNAEIQNVNDVGVIFVNDPTEDNCKAYLKAAEQYLDAVEKYENCPDIDQGQFTQQLTQAREVLAQIDCG